MQLIFILIQWKFNPYLSAEANTAEFTLLICLPIVNIAQISVIQQFAPFTVKVMLSLMIIIAVPVALICAYQVMKRAMGNLQLIPTDPDVESESEESTDQENVNVVNNVELAIKSPVSMEFADLLSPQFTRETTGASSSSTSYLEETESPGSKPL